jgi:hypothetical protein
MKNFPNLQTKAAAYAAYKDLERMLNEDGDLPPGFSANLSGVDSLSSSPLNFQKTAITKFVATLRFFKKLRKLLKKGERYFKKLLKELREN